MLALVGAASSAFAQAQEQRKASEEALLLNEIPSVFGASRFDQAVTEAPASVSVITAEEIATHGWRTLGDVLRTVRGFYVTNDRSYSYVGTRGFARPGDYNGRILLLIDGIRANENVYDGAYVGFEGVVDMAIVDRIEVIRGPSSSLYGANAFFGIINVVTLRGRASDGVRITADVGSFGTRDVAISGGGRVGKGLEFVGSLGRRRMTGQDLYFAEFDSASSNRGLAVGRDGEERDRAFAKLEWGPLALQGNLNDRTKDVPTAAYGSLFNQRRNYIRDRLSSLALRLQKPLHDGSSLTGSVALNRYDYLGIYPYDSSTTREQGIGRWGVADLQYSRLVAARHRIAVGGTFIRNARQEVSAVEDSTGAPIYFNDTPVNTYGIFAITEVHLNSRVIFNAGLRYDNSRWLNNRWSPRAAFIIKLDEGSALKLLYGTAFRAPTNYERFYNDGPRTQKGNLGLLPERVATGELLLEKVLSSRAKLTTSLYRYHADRLIDFVEDANDGLFQYNNSGRADGYGIETEVELELGPVLARSSYSLQRSRDASKVVLSNSPTHMGVLTVSMPVAGERARVGIETRMMSQRLNERFESVAGHVVSNFVLSSRHLTRGLEASVSVLNLFDARYADPVSDLLLQRAIFQDGRALRATLGYHF